MTSEDNAINSIRQIKLENSSRCRKATPLMTQSTMHLWMYILQKIKVIDHINLLIFYTFHFTQLITHSDKTSYCVFPFSIRRRSTRKRTVLKYARDHSPARQILQRVQMVRAVSCEISRILRSLEHLDSNSIFQIFARAQFSRLRFRVQCSSSSLLLSERALTCDLFRSQLYPNLCHNRVPTGISDKIRSGRN